MVENDYRESINYHICAMRQLNHNDYKTIGRHFLFWLSYLLYIIISKGWQENGSWRLNLSPHMLTDSPVVVLVVYANWYILMPALYLKHQYVQYTIGLLFLLLLGGSIVRFFSWWLWLPRQRISDPAGNWPSEFWIAVRIAKNAADIFPVVAAAIVLRVMRNSTINERKLRAMEKEKFSAEMGLLKAQINPHFFFNTLNSLYALTLSGSNKSSDLVLRLSGLMRYMLYETGTSKVLLRNEITHLENYTGIEQMRFADRLDLSFQYSGDLEAKMIAPLLLLPFVENAFKHGIADSSGWITVDINVTGDRLFIKVENSFKASAKPKAEGLGLNNVKRRLEITYPRQHELTSEQDDGIYKVALNINL